MIEPIEKPPGFLRTWARAWIEIHGVMSCAVGWVVGTFDQNYPRATYWLVMGFGCLTLSTLWRRK